MKLHLPIIALVAAALIAPLQAADETKPTTEAKAETTKSKPLPFKGKIASVDKDAKTITLEAKTGEGRVIVVGAETKLEKMDTKDAATWDDLKVGEEVRGSYSKNADGKMQAFKVKIGPKAEGDKTEKPAKKAKGEPKAE